MAINLQKIIDYVKLCIFIKEFKKQSELTLA